jgi:hypothetical protein
MEKIIDMATGSNTNGMKENTFHRYYHRYSPIGYCVTAT